jgi:hypothetical protein
MMTATEKAIRQEHYWDDLPVELSFASSDLSYAYKELLKVPLTALAVSDAKKQMDRAIDRAARAMALAQKELFANKR